MITAEDLGSAMPIAEPLFDQMQDLYQRLPETRCECDQPGLCCIFLPEMTVLEALQWLRVMQAMPDSEMTTKLKANRDFKTSH